MRGSAVKRIGAGVGLIVLLTLSGTVLADGKFYWREEVPPRIPYQRALLLFTEGEETLCLQTKYSFSSDAAVGQLGWVVPVPEVPELASASAEDATSLFSWLGRVSQPKVTDVSEILASVLLVAAPFAVAVALLMFSSLPIFPAWARRHRRGLGWLLLISPLGGIVMTTLLTTAGGVEVLLEERVGIYEVRVVRADDASGLIEWLQERGFRFDDADRTAFEDYVEAGWVFAVAEVRPLPTQERGEVISEGLVAPLILRFKAEHPVYPLTLTSLAGHDTTVLLYLATEHRMECAGRLPLRHAGANTAWDLLKARGLFDVEPAGFFKGHRTDVPFLCRFRGVLSPGDMREDLTFTRAPTDEPHRERLVVW